MTTETLQTHDESIMLILGIGEDSKKYDELTISVIATEPRINKK